MSERKYTDEDFREVMGYSGYRVSRNGVVLSKRFNRPLKQYRNEDGYMMCSLSKEGISRTVRVHRLVAMAFVPNPNNLPQVNHKDGNKTNNSFDNLEWVDNSGNIMHRYYNLGLGTMRKVRCVETEIVYQSQREAERLTGINSGNISSCCIHRPKYKTAGGFHWEFVDNLVAEMTEGWTRGKGDSFSQYGGYVTVNAIEEMTEGK